MWASIWPICGLSVQSLDPRFVQDNPQIVLIRTLRITYAYVRTHMVPVFMVSGHVDVLREMVTHKDGLSDLSHSQSK